MISIFGKAFFGRLIFYIASLAGIFWRFWGRSERKQGFCETCVSLYVERSCSSVRVLWTAYLFVCGCVVVHYITQHRDEQTVNNAHADEYI